MHRWKAVRILIELVTWGCYEEMTLEEQFNGSVSRLVRMGWDSRGERESEGQRLCQQMREHWCCLHVVTSVEEELT